MERRLLYILASPAIEEAMVDWLLRHPDVTGFTSVAAQGHGSSTHSMSLAEQVAGRKKQLLFLVETDSHTAGGIIKSLHSEFSGSGLHYWLVPLEEAGHLE